MTIIELAKAIFAQWIWISLLVSALLAASAFLDANLKDELKSKFLGSVYGSEYKDRSWTGELPSYYAAIHALFGLGNFGVFVFRSAAATAIMLALLSFLQAIVNPDGFSDATAPLFTHALRFDGRAITLLLGIFVVDLVSIYQTATFLRISRGCQNIAELLFLSAADVIISILLFIIIFPLFVTLSFFANAPQSRSFSILLSSGLTRQDTTISAIRSVLLFDPRARATLSEDNLKNLLERKWHFRNIDVSTYNSNNKLTLQEAINSANGAGTIVVQTRGNITDGKVMETLIHMLRNRPFIGSASVMDSSQGFYNSYSLVQLSVLNKITMEFFWKIYGTLVGQMNFLDSELIDVLTLRSPRLTTNDVAFQYNRLSLLPPIRGLSSGEEYIYCDGKHIVAKDYAALNPDSKYDQCEEAVVTDSVAFANIRSVGLYDDDAEQIPISPLALSSLTATIVIYYLLLAKIVFRLVRPIFGSAIQDGDQFLQRHLLTITTVLLLLIGSPLAMLVWRLLSPA